jgi:hypothetical protein
MTALQWIVKEAKSIKKKYPKRFSKWTEYVAQASAIYASKHKGKSPVGKKKVSGYVATKRKGKVTNVIYTKKKLGALPVGFTGNIWGIKFKVVNQFDIYGDVAAIVENIETGHRIVTFDGKGSANEKADVFAGYVARHGTGGSVNDADMKALKSRLLKFATNMQKEVKDYNAGKKKTIKKQPLKIVAPKLKKVTHKKSAPKKSVKKHHTHWGTIHAHERRVNGIKKKKISEQSILNKIHKVKDDVNKLDEAQHKHMMGKISHHNLDKIKSSLQELKQLETHLAILKNVKPKIVKSQLPVIRREIKNTVNSIKEIKTHIVQLKKHI